jgi:integrase
MTTHNHFPPPFGVHLCADTLGRGSRIRVRVRWTDPLSHKRRSRSITVDSDAEAEPYFCLIRSARGADIDPLITLSDYVDLVGERYLRGIDMTSTAAVYQAGLRLRVLPSLGHIHLRSITAGIVDRTIDYWELTHSASTLKNTIAVLTRLLDEAVRDEVIVRNPARDRASRRCHAKGHLQHVNPVPGPADIERIGKACAAIHQNYCDHVMLSAFLAARTSEVAGLRVGDVDWTNRVVTIERQYFPGNGGLCIKPPKGRRSRRVPIIEPLEPVLRRLTLRRERDLPLLRGPRGGVITTAALRDATNWDALAAGLGFPGLRRRGLRHAGATWFANAGVPIHVVSDILGHASVETTRAYLHTDGTALQNAAACLNERLRVAPIRG